MSKKKKNPLKTILTTSYRITLNVKVTVFEDDNKEKLQFFTFLNMQQYILYIKISKINHYYFLISKNYS